MKRLSARNFVVHPWVLAVFPVLFLYRRNMATVSPGELVFPLLTSLGATTVFFAVAWLAVKNAARAALITTIAVFIVFSYSRVYPAFLDRRIAGWTWGRQTILVPLWCLLAVVLVFLASRTKKWLDEITRNLNVVTAVLLAIVLIPAILSRPSQAASEVPARVVAPLKLKAPASDRLRNIYYVVFEDRASGDALKSIYHQDDAPFLDKLRAKGLFVAKSLANYPRTTHSLASTLNMQYLDRVIDSTGANCGWGTFYRMMQAHKVARTLRSVGYRYINIGSWWNPTAHDPLADADLTPPAPSEFSRVLYNTTLLSAIGETAVPALDWGMQYWRITRTQLDRLEATKSMKGPFFVFAHIQIPHPPWVFDRDGSFLRKGVSLTRTSSENYLNQHNYTNDRILRLVDKLLAGAKRSRPVVILQSDEGTRPPRANRLGDVGFRWDKATPKELRTNLNILNAYYWPGLKATGLYPSITPVNSFRLMFDRYFGAKLPLLDDKIFAYENAVHPCRVHDVTAKVQPLQAAEIAAQR